MWYPVNLVDMRAGRGVLVSVRTGSVSWGEGDISIAG